jgi:hypothetical protein
MPIFDVFVTESGIDLDTNALDRPFRRVLLWLLSTAVVSSSSGIELLVRTREIQSCSGIDGLDDMIDTLNLLNPEVTFGVLVLVINGLSHGTLEVAFVTNKDEGRGLFEVGVLEKVNEIVVVVVLSSWFALSFLGVVGRSLSSSDSSVLLLTKGSERLGSAFFVVYRSIGRTCVSTTLLLGLVRTREGLFLRVFLFVAATHRLAVSIIDLHEKNVRCVMYCRMKRTW